MDSEQPPNFRPTLGAFRWDGVAHQPYKQDGEAPFKDISRQVLFHEDNLACELRYFEMDAGGFSRTLGHSRIACWISSQICSGGWARGHGTWTLSLRRIDGTLRLMKRDFATKLLGMVAMSLPKVLIWTERQLIWTTSPSIGPSNQTRSPIA